MTEQTPEQVKGHILGDLDVLIAAQKKVDAASVAAAVAARDAAQKALADDEVNDAATEAALATAQAEIVRLQALLDNQDPEPVTPPTNVTPAAISDNTPTVGQVLTGTDGTWTGSPSFEREWLLDGADTNDTDGTYTVPNQPGKVVGFRVQASNAGGAATQVVYTAPIAAPEPPAGNYDLSVPSGYSVLYAEDYTSGADRTDDAKIQVYSGTQGNNRAQFRAANVVKRGPNGRVLTAECASSSAAMYSGAIKIPSVKIPRYFYMRVVFKLDGFRTGSWPSSWLRPHADSVTNDGEIDMLEGFGSHIGTNGQPKSGFARIFGTTIILTPYGGSQKNITGDLDAAYPQSAWGTEHVLEYYKTPNTWKAYADGKLVDTITRAQSGDTARWDAQMEAAGVCFYYREDHQAGNVSGHTEAGEPASFPFLAKQMTKALVIGVPAA